MRVSNTSGSPPSDGWFLHFATVSNGFFQVSLDRHHFCCNARLVFFFKTWRKKNVQMWFKCLLRDFKQKWQKKKKFSSQMWLIYRLVGKHLVKRCLVLIPNTVSVRSQKDDYHNWRLEHFKSRFGWRWIFFSFSHVLQTKSSTEHLLKVFFAHVLGWFLTTAYNSGSTTTDSRDIVCPTYVAPVKLFQLSWWCRLDGMNTVRQD